MDRENAITHLMIIKTWASFARERDLQFFTAKHLEDIAQWADDALALVKKQDELLRKLQKDKDKLCLDVSEWKHKYHDGPLKEQEVKPDKCIICEGCGHKLQDDWNWCPWCRLETSRGRRVKSNGF